MMDKCTQIAISHLCLLVVDKTNQQVDKKSIFGLMKVSCKRLLALVILCTLACSIATAQVKVRTVDYDDELEQPIDSFRTLHLVIAGNVYQPEQLIKEAYNAVDKKYEFGHQLKYINPILSLGDVVIANLKTSFTADNTSPYSAPDELALALKYSGVNTCLLANSNTSNIDKLGLQRTKKVLDIFDIASTGAFPDNITRNGNYPLLISKKGFKIALLNYTTITQRPSISRDFIINQIDRNQIERDMRVARALEPDFIIVYLDWGANYQELPALTQESTAQFLLEQGAGIVVGTFPNTVQRIDLMTYYYRAIQRQGLVCYSLGNLISGVNEDRAKAGIVMDLEVKKNNLTGQITIGDYGFIPVWSYFDTLSSPKRVYVMPTAPVQSNDIWKSLPKPELLKIRNATLQLRQMLGRTSDEIQYNITEKTVQNVFESTELTNAPMNNKFNPFDERNLKASAVPVVKKALNVEDTIYRIQFYEMENPIPIDTTYYTHLRGYEMLYENERYRYLIGAYTKLADILPLYRNVMKPRYKTCLIVAYHEGRRVKIIQVDKPKD
jgi:poly-gamma-glutamate capsule biosynthesis protein CapA/YwtB (metallophosphatase superfamily)